MVERCSRVGIHPSLVSERNVVSAAGDEHILTQFYSSRTLRHLVLSSADGASAAAVSFVETLWAEVFDGHCKSHLGARSIFSASVTTPASVQQACTIVSLFSHASVANLASVLHLHASGPDELQIHMATVLNQMCYKFAGGHAEKVLAALLECGSDSVKQSARAQLEVRFWFSNGQRLTAAPAALHTPSAARWLVFSRSASLCNPHCDQLTLDWDACTSAHWSRRQFAGTSRPAGGPVACGTQKGA